MIFIWDWNTFQKYNSPLDVFQFCQNIWWPNEMRPKNSVPSKNSSTPVPSFKRMKALKHIHQSVCQLRCWISFWALKSCFLQTYIRMLCHGRYLELMTRFRFLQLSILRILSMNLLFASRLHNKSKMMKWLLALLLGLIITCPR